MPDKEPTRERYGVGVPEHDRAPIKFFEGIRFLLRDKGAGDSTVFQRLQELQSDIASPNGGFFDAHAQEFLRCFQPVKGPLLVDTKEVPTLLDQLNPAFQELNAKERREVLEYLTHDLSQSIVRHKQPRAEKTGRKDINARTRDAAEGVYTTLEEKILETMDPTPIPGQTQFDRFIKIPVRTGQAVGVIALALKLGGCTPINPPITPETTRPPIVQIVEPPTPIEITPETTGTPNPTPEIYPSIDIGIFTPLITPDLYSQLAALGQQDITAGKAGELATTGLVRPYSELSTAVQQQLEQNFQSVWNLLPSEFTQGKDWHEWMLLAVNGRTGDNRRNMPFVLTGDGRISWVVDSGGFRSLDAYGWKNYRANDGTLRYALVEFKLPDGTIPDPERLRVLYQPFTASQNGTEVTEYLAVMFYLDDNGNELYRWNPEIGRFIPSEHVATKSTVVMFSDMTAEDGPQQCAENSIDLNSPNFDQQLQAWMESIRKQVGVPDSNVSLRTIPGTYPGGLKDLYPRASFYFQSRFSEGKAPIVACGEAQLGDATGRIQFVDSFPFPTADGGTEPIMFGMVHEDNTLKVLYSASQYPYVEDNYVFRTLQKGRLQVRLEFYINSYYNAIPSTVDLYQLEVQRNINQTGATIEPYLYTKLEAQRFSELFIQVFYKGNRSPEVLSELKALMQNHLLPGYILIDTLE